VTVGQGHKQETISTQNGLRHNDQRHIGRTAVPLK
jgi:hypothetical protein